MDKENLLKKQKELQQQQELAKQNFHQVTGALALITQQLNELEEASKPKEEKPKEEIKK